MIKLFTKKVVEKTTQQILKETAIKTVVENPLPIFLIGVSVASGVKGYVKNNLTDYRHKTMEERIRLSAEETGFPVYMQTVLSTMNDYEKMVTFMKKEKIKSEDIDVFFQYLRARKVILK